jgi:hypothetical protein
MILLPIYFTTKSIKPGVCLTEIEGEIPLIDSTNAKIGGFSIHKRKTYPYLPRNEHILLNNGKTYPYFSLAIISGTFVGNQMSSFFKIINIVFQYW